MTTTNYVDEANTWLRELKREQGDFCPIVDRLRELHEFHKGALRYARMGFHLACAHEAPSGLVNELKQDMLEHERYATTIREAIAQLS